VIVLIDTNILLDVLQARAPFHIPATEVWRAVESGRVQGFLSAISFNNVFYIARKHVGTAAALQQVRVLRQKFQTVALDDAIIDAALALQVTDFEDAIQAASASKIGADYVVTRDIAGFGQLGVRTATAEELLPLLPP
jgi:predicted nucleic acid-binding protein